MSKPLDWDARIGRRIRLRDLYILFAVAQHGSMARAGAHLGMSQSAVSQAIAALEHAVQAPLLDRTPRGVELTVYGAALKQRGEAAFEELRSGVKDIEILADPAVGEVRVVCTASLAAGFLPAAIERFSSRYPKVKLNVLEEATALRGFAPLRDRTADLILTLATSQLEDALRDDLSAEVLFRERICLAAAKQSPWARQRKIDLADLVDAPLISPPSDTPGGAAVIAAFRAARLPVPSVTITTFSVHVRSILSTHGRFIAVLPVSVLRFNPGLFALKELAIDLQVGQLPALMVTLRNRTLSPPIERFMACARDVAEAMRVAPVSRKSRTTPSRA